MSIYKVLIFHCINDRGREDYQRCCSLLLPYVLIVLSPGHGLNQNSEICMVKETVWFCSAVSGGWLIICATHQVCAFAGIAFYLESTALFVVIISSWSELMSSVVT